VDRVVPVVRAANVAAPTVNVAGRMVSVAVPKVAMIAVRRPRMGKALVVPAVPADPDRVAPARATTPLKR
jgi:hypothetical protein